MHAPEDAKSRAAALASFFTDAKLREPVKFANTVCDICMTDSDSGILALDSLLRAASLAKANAGPRLGDSALSLMKAGISDRLSIPYASQVALITDKLQGDAMADALGAMSSVLSCKELGMGMHQLTGRIIAKTDGESTSRSLNAVSSILSSPNFCANAIEMMDTIISKCLKEAIGYALMSFSMLLDHDKFDTKKSFALIDGKVLEECGFSNVFHTHTVILSSPAFVPHWLSTDMFPLANGIMVVISRLSVSESPDDAFAALRDIIVTEKFKYKSLQLVKRMLTGTMGGDIYGKVTKVLRDICGFYVSPTEAKHMHSLHVRHPRRYH